MFGTKGVPTTCGSRMLEGWHPPYDATITTRLKQAGAILLGKTNMDEFAMGSSTENSAYGASRNPWDLDEIPGGSSRRLGRGGGRLRWRRSRSAPTPAARSVSPPPSAASSALKPTYGRVSRYGLIAFASSLDQIGPFAPDRADAALLLEVISGHDPCDST